MSRQLDFFFFVGSTYTYLAVNRAEQLAARDDIALRWRPFSVRSIMVEQNNRPFVGKPAKLAYMWRDLERRARRHGTAFKSAPVYPIDADELANRTATVAAQEGWCPAFAKAVYTKWFVDNEDPGQVGPLTEVLEALGKDARDVLRRADSAAIRDRYAAQTQAARALGIFGSPTFVHGSELFWGDDRLEEALEWCRAH